MGTEPNEYLTINALVNGLKQNGIKADPNVLEAKIKDDEIDAEILPDGQYLIPVYELERLVASVQCSTSII